MLVGVGLYLFGGFGGWLLRGLTDRADAALEAGQQGVDGATQYRLMQCEQLASPLRPGLQC